MNILVEASVLDDVTMGLHYVFRNGEYFRLNKMADGTV